MTDTKDSSQAQPALPAQDRSFHLVDKGLHPFLEESPASQSALNTCPRCARRRSRLRCPRPRHSLTIASSLDLPTIPS